LNNEQTTISPVPSRSSFAARRAGHAQCEGGNEETGQSSQQPLIKGKCVARETLTSVKELASPAVFRKITWKNGTKLLKLRAYGRLKDKFTVPIQWRRRWWGGASRRSRASAGLVCLYQRNSAGFEEADRGSLRQRSAAAHL
jgi:hypothetical protein